MTDNCTEKSAASLGNNQIQKGAFVDKKRQKAQKFVSVGLPGDYNPADNPKRENDCQNR